MKRPRGRKCVRRNEVLRYVELGSLLAFKVEVEIWLSDRFRRYRGTEYKGARLLGVINIVVIVKIRSFSNNGIRRRYLCKNKTR